MIRHHAAALGASTRSTLLAVGASTESVLFLRSCAAKEMAVALAVALAVELAVAAARELTSSIRLIFEDDVADALSRLVKQVLNLLSLRVVEVGAV